MYQLSEGTLDIDDCAFFGNTAHYGGGVCTNGSDNSGPNTIRLLNCLFSGNGNKSPYNQAYYGGAIYNCNTDFAVPPNPLAKHFTMYLINCTLSNNTVSTAGNGIYMTDDMGNLSSQYNSLYVENSILWNAASVTQIARESISVPVYVYYTDIQPSWAGTGNLNTNPLFVSPAGTDGVVGTTDDNLRLKVTPSVSPCIDAGYDSYATGAGLTHDLEGHTRIVDYPPYNDYGTEIDMGAYEHSNP